MTNVVAADVESLRIGQPVHVVLDPAGEGGDAVYRFAAD